MSRRIFILLGMLSVFCAACSWQQTVDRRLLQADSLMKEYPDSALRLLQDIHSEQLIGKANCAYHALLLTQARDKNYITQPDDSAIRYAVRYYDSIGDVTLQARAHYLWGGYYRDKNNAPLAIREYLTAMPLAKKVEKKRLLTVIYNNAGYIYYKQGLNKRADSIYQLTEELAIQLNDSLLWAEALSQQGMIFLRKGKKFYRTAEDKMLRAYWLSVTLKNTKLKSNITSALSSLYSYMDENTKALEFARKNQYLQKDTTRCFKTYLLLGDAFYKMGQYDSALIYLHKALPSKAYNIRLGIYMRLADIAIEQGDLPRSIQMERMYSTYKDSLQHLDQSNEIIEVEKDLQILFKQNQSRQTVIYEYASYILFILISLVIYLVCLHKRHKNKTLLLLREKQALFHESSYLKEVIHKKEFQIDSLQNKIAKEANDERKKQKLQCELEALYTEKKALLKELFNYSEICAKIERIIKDYRQYESSDEELTHDDWQILIAEINKRWNNITVCLNAKYPSLSKNDIHVCCLTLLDIQRQHIGYLMKSSRSAYYKRENNILENKMGYIHKYTTLKEVLNSIV